MPKGDLQRKFKEIGEAQMNFYKKENLKKGKIYISPKLHKRVNAIEMFAVLKNIKPAASQPVRVKGNTNIKKIITGLEEMKKIYSLHYAISKEKYLVDSNRDFSAVVPADTQEGHFILGYSLSPDLAQKAVEYFMKKQKDSSYSRKFGEVMGYPECCLDFGDSLSGNIRKLEKIEKDLLWSRIHIRSFRNSTKISPLLNIFTIPILSHVPCHLDCAESKRYAIKILKELRKENPMHAALREYFLLKPNALFWNYTDKILLLGNKMENVMKYNDFYPVSVSAKKFYQPSKRFAKKFQRAVSLIKKGDKLVMGYKKFDVFKGEVHLGSISKERPFECVLF